MTHNTDVARATSNETCGQCNGYGYRTESLGVGSIKSWCGSCRGVGRIARPAYSPESAIGAPDETDRRRAELAQAKARGDRFEAALLSALNKAGRG